mmetsp:Transcript_11712/g.15908  ORF Transcript_11712/g.15908 Transcript_11712/m.15908 type:complete len:159 (-) Transcript_11712:95-571(-)|eukprot:CAMPEP_0196585046 /NCGR_PEP_ID=MMETSP1081-20130531/49362_1 /TAXON_ID=36882 /ORGANISM="Pyramimonas amylifera, Strain CCMP720" /LENGTH=158 /DNA_ID=CAMNT_0041906463 /DNA_START=180 /DNA_END=656 /DNA_ORIENTATION=+
MNHCYFATSLIILAAFLNAVIGIDVNTLSSVAVSTTDTVPVPIGAPWSSEVTELLDTNNFAGAIEILKSVDPPTVDVYNLLGHCFQNLSPPDFTEAENCYMMGNALLNNQCESQQYLDGEQVKMGYLQREYSELQKQYITFQVSCTSLRINLHKLRGG